MFYSVKCLLIILIIILPTAFSYAQIHYFAIATGAISPNTELNKYYMSNPDIIHGFNYQYTPKSAVFLVGADLKYHANNRSLYIPLSFNFKMGDRVLYTLGGGGMPVIHMKSNVIRSIEFGGIIQTGFQTVIGKKWIIMTNFGFLFVPYTRPYPVKNGELRHKRSLAKYSSISLGLGYTICQNNTKKESE